MLHSLKRSLSLTNRSSLLLAQSRDRGTLTQILHKILADDHEVMQ
jgi:hypothetical protein